MSLLQEDGAALLTETGSNLLSEDDMALAYDRVKATAEAVADVSNQLATLYNVANQLLEFNSDQAIDWAAGSTPAYITEQANGNLDGLQFTRQDVANVIGSLDNLRKLLTNQAVTQGDHLGNVNHLVRPLG